MRWQHPARGLVPPDKFIPLAEETGSIMPIGAWVLDEASRQMKTWLDAGLVGADASMCVNVSGRQFDDALLAEKVMTVLDANALPYGSLELEITESTVANSLQRTVAVVTELRSLGISVSIDDFGTGYSSLNHLKTIPFTKLKIDQSFVRDIPHDSDDMAISSAVIALGRKLSLEVLAEGVETEEQCAFLYEEGCHSAQGYYFSRPLDAEAATHWLAARR